jgi:hypothetical protein
MYTKVFRTMYEGTLADNWQALVTFQQLLILANDEGVVDMTISAIHRHTGIPQEILEAGIKVLEAPDHGSRTPDMEGRRIARMDEHRDWGWFLVNFKKYRQMTTREEKKEADRARMRERRSAENPDKSGTSQDVAKGSDESQTVANSSQLSFDVANVAYTDLDTDKDQEHPPTVVGARTRFLEFWSEYPNKTGKKPCEERWRKRKLDRVADFILADVRRRKADDKKWRDGFVPNPETYLNQERWNDGDTGVSSNGAIGPKSETPEWLVGAR